MVESIKYSDYISATQHELDCFFSKAFETNGFKYDPEKNHTDLRNIYSVFCNAGGTFFIARNNKQVIGTIGVKIMKEGNIAEIKCLYVLPDFKGLGIGKELLLRAIKFVKSKKIKSLKLDVKKQAISAIELYRKNSFYEIPRYNNNTNDVLFMQLDLS